MAEDVGALFGRRRPRPNLSINVQAVSDEQRQLNLESDEEKMRFDAKYEALDEILGQGSASLVKRGRRRDTGLDVALKMVRTSDPEHQTMARAEFDLISPLDHPHIIKVYDFFCTAVQTIVIVELFAATSLQEAVRQSSFRQLDEETSRLLMRQTTDALDFLHRHRIIHRDIKPQNLLVSNDLATLKVIDFNVAKRLEEGGSLTATGTAQYAAPEVLLGQSASEGVDVWSAGLCLYFMLVGSLPFRLEDFRNPHDFGAHIFNHPVALSGPQWDEVSEPCKDVLRQCLAVRMQDRPAPMTLLKSNWLTPNRRERPRRSCTTALPRNFSAGDGDEGVFDTDEPKVVRRWHTQPLEQPTVFETSPL